MVDTLVDSMVVLLAACSAVMLDVAAAASKELTRVDETAGDSVGQMVAPSDVTTAFPTVCCWAD